MLAHQSCPRCQTIENRIKQHEKYIAQLVDLVAKTNRRIIDLEERHLLKLDAPISKRF
ncbi:hypothetical protein [Salinibacillus xinjiangensis]|uniref:Uncharacterized protein n=1 Tax=Salinibacillus xinjiangensis TaxID=1229268 RepID=A0A6G1X1X1_9BACI|nr:hypothetical protein [Salinibacillus xinjiangensis]MRG84934.1 hypothetical protein [Salinibacillus xinjiangensis]